MGRRLVPNLPLVILGARRKESQRVLRQERRSDIRNTATLLGEANTLPEIPNNLPPAVKKCQWAISPEL